MADYCAFPVWDRTPGADPGEVDPATLGVSSELVRELTEWNAQYESIAANDFRFDDRAAFGAWKRRGRGLANWLQRELGNTARVTYHRSG